MGPTSESSRVNGIPNVRNSYNVITSGGHKFQNFIESILVYKIPRNDCHNDILVHNISDTVQENGNLNHH